ncbi:cupin domain-containing protein [Lentisphaerota bacterium WC36G]|nr:cupin domain-containing protein [Lentisphaerae bacterium WC36]
MKYKELKYYFENPDVNRFEAILQSFVKPQFVSRKYNYHSFDYHILRMRDDLCKSFADEKFTLFEVLALLATIYFHDIVYNVTSNTNEEDSALEFKDFIEVNKQLELFIGPTEMSLNDFAVVVEDLIISTKIGTNINENSSRLVKVIHDLDYASFANLERLQDDAEYIRRESGLDEEEFKIRRSEFFKLLAGKTIFFTEQFKIFNEQAQANIKKVLNISSIAEKIIEKLELKPLTIEGGYFNEIYRSETKIVDEGRTAGTSIYYLLKNNQVSSWHKVESDEIWYYHSGCSAKQLLIFEDGSIEERIIGNDILNGEIPQSIIPAGTWQATKLIQHNKYDFGLFGAAVFPCFEYEDFTGATVNKICELFPQHQNVIRDLFV